MKGSSLPPKLLEKKSKRITVISGPFFYLKGIDMLAIVVIALVVIAWKING